MEHPRRGGDPAGARQGEQVVDQFRQPPARGQHVIDVLEAVGPQLRRVFLGQQVAVRLQGPQRLLEVVRDHGGEFVQLLVDGAQLGDRMLQLVAAAAQLVAHAVALGHVLGGAAGADETAVLVDERDRADPDVDHGAVALDPVHLQLAVGHQRVGAALGRFAPARPLPFLDPRRRQQPCVGLLVEGFALVAQRLDHGVVAGHEAALGVEAEEHDRRVVVQVAVALFQPLQILVDPHQAGVALRQFLGAAVQLLFRPDAIGHVLEVAAVVQGLAVLAVARQHVHLHVAPVRGVLRRAAGDGGHSAAADQEAEGEVVALAVLQALLEELRQLVHVGRVDPFHEGPAIEFLAAEAEQLLQGGREVHPAQVGREARDHVAAGAGRTKGARMRVARSALQAGTHQLQRFALLDAVGQGLAVALGKGLEFLVERSEGCRLRLGQRAVLQVGA